MKHHASTKVDWWPFPPTRDQQRYLVAMGAWRATYGHVGLVWRGTVAELKAHGLLHPGLCVYWGRTIHAKSKDGRVSARIRAKYAKRTQLVTVEAILYPENWDDLERCFELQRLMPRCSLAECLVLSPMAAEHFGCELGVGEH